MYKKSKHGWMAHLDFRIMETVVMLGVYFAALIPSDAAVFKNYLSGALILALFGMFVATIPRLYIKILHRGIIIEFLISVAYVGVCDAVTLLYLVFIEEMIPKTLNICIFVAGSIVLDFLVKLGLRWLVKKGLSAADRRSNLILVSSDGDIEKMIDRFNKNFFNQFTIAGVIVYGSQKYKVGDEINGCKVLCDLEDLPNLVQNVWLDEVYINLPSTRVPREIIRQILTMGIVVHRVIDFDMDYHRNKVINKLYGYTCLTESVSIMPTSQYLTKRFIDIIGGLVGSLMTIILTIIVGPLIFITDPGPIFFTQKRVGKGGRVFKMVKFRSMYKDAEARKAELMSQNQVADGMMFKMDNDPRILGSGKDGTKKGIGWFIRKFSIDEFPQFFMVVKGDMSLVGTRPPTLDEWEKYGPTHRARMAIRPGITGMWQANGRSDITDFEKVVELDMEYIKNMSVMFDIKLILKTIKGILTGSGAK
ncbi:MAG: sugar transferase [Clostridiales bacterium]|nr:sugar transferase [Clostridiales bacterium]